MTASNAPPEPLSESDEASPKGDDPQDRGWFWGNEEIVPPPDAGPGLLFWVVAVALTVALALVLILVAGVGL